MMMMLLFVFFFSLSLSLSLSVERETNDPFYRDERKRERILSLWGWDRDFLSIVLSLSISPLSLFLCLSVRLSVPFFLSVSMAAFPCPIKKNGHRVLQRNKKKKMQCLYGQIDVEFLKLY